KRCQLAWLGPCRGSIQADHWLKVSKLREMWRRAHSRLYPSNKLPAAIRLLRDTELEDLIRDARNGIAACEHHHTLKDRALIKIPRSRVPLHVESFAAEFGLGWALNERHGLRR